MASTKQKEVEVKTLKVESLYYTQKGVIVGLNLDNVRAFEKTRNFEAETLDEIQNKVTKAFNSNTLDSELVFKKPVAAGIEIVEVKTVIIDDEKYTHENVYNFIVGDKEYFLDLVDQGIIIDTNVTIDLD